MRYPNQVYSVVGGGVDNSRPWRAAAANPKRGDSLARAGLGLIYGRSTPFNSAASKKGFQRDNLAATITSISRAWASAKTFLRSIRSFLAREPVSLNAPTMWWSARWRTSGDRVPSAVSAACVAAGPTNGESRSAGARHCDRNVEDDRNGGADYSSLRRPQCRASQPLPAGP